MAVYTTIDDPSLFFEAVKYSSNGTAIGSGGLTVTGFDFQPDFLFLKQRDADESNGTYNSVRGTTKSLRFNGTDAEDTRTEGITAFNSNGFTCGNDSRINPGGTHPMIAWGWKAGTTSGLSGGTITPSAYSINTTSGFGMYAYAGNSTAGATIAHGLGKKPSWISCKRLNTTGGWTTYHSSMGATKFAYLDLTDIFDTGSTEWNNTEPTTSVFSLGTHGTVNYSTGTYIAYVWTAIQGFSKFGSYTGNGNADGPFINLGFRPAFFLIKNTANASSEWRIYDNKRDTFNEVDNNLQTHVGDAEASSGDMDFCSNGVKLRSSDGNVNQDGYAHIFMAFSEAPLVNSKGVPCNAR